MNNARDWIAYLQAFAPSFAVLVAIGVAVMQAYLQRQHLKHDLYNKRFRVFSAIQQVLHDPKATTNAKDLLPSLQKETAELSFLFGQEIKDFRSEIDSVLRELRWQEHQIEGADHTVEDNKSFVMAVIHWDALSDKAERLFGRYLQLHHERSWFGRWTARVNRWMDADVPDKLASRYEN
jgi:hypothetical protein